MKEEGEPRGSPMLTKCFGWWVNLPKEAAASEYKMALLREKRSKLPAVTTLIEQDEQLLKDMIRKLNTQPLEDQHRTIAAYNQKEMELLGHFRLKQKHDRLDKEESAARRDGNTPTQQRKEADTGFSSIANGAFDDLAPPPLDRKCNGMLLVFLEKIEDLDKEKLPDSWARAIAVGKVQREVVQKREEKEEQQRRADFNAAIAVGREGAREKKSAGAVGRSPPSIADAAQSPSSTAPPAHPSSFSSTTPTQFTPPKPTDDADNTTTPPPKQPDKELRDKTDNLISDFSSQYGWAGMKSKMEQFELPTIITNQEHREEFFSGMKEFADGQASFIKKTLVQVQPYAVVTGAFELGVSSIGRMPATVDLIFTQSVKGMQYVKDEFDKRRGGGGGGEGDA